MGTLSIPNSASPEDGRRFVFDIDRRLEALDTAILVAEWNLQCGRSRVGTDRLQLKRAALLTDPGLLEWVRRALRRTWPKNDHRRLELLERVLLDTQVEQHPEIVRVRGKLQRRMVAFRPRWKGKRVPRSVVWKALRESPDPSERRTAYYALEELYRPLEEELRGLVRLRNERARELGFRDFPELRLGFFGLTSARLNELAESSSMPARSRLRELREQFLEASGESEWYPWDVSYAHRLKVKLPEDSFPLRGMLPSILRATQKWGFRTDRMRFHVVYHDLPAGGLTLAPHPPEDVRILVHKSGGFQSYSTMFHEFGHAIQSASTQSPAHLLRWHENVPGFGPFHEGIGHLFEEIPRTAAWLSRRRGITPKAAREFSRRLPESKPVEQAFITAWFRPELALYANPDADPRGEAQAWMDRLYGFGSHPARSFADNFYIDAPVYAPNYLLANLFSHQLQRELRKRFGSRLWPNRRIGPWLTKTWFAPGSLIEWPDKLKETTGHRLDARAFREDFPG
jgi:hypothetical protein